MDKRESGTTQDIAADGLDWAVFAGRCLESLEHRFGEAVKAAKALGSKSGFMNAHAAFSEVRSAISDIKREIEGLADIHSVAVEPEGDIPRFGNGQSVKADRYYPHWGCRKRSEGNVSAVIGNGWYRVDLAMGGCEVFHESELEPA